MVIWVYKQPQLKPLWLLLGPVGTVGGCDLLCSQDGGSGLEVTRQLEQHSQSSLACFSSTYLWINFGFIWIIHLCFFDSQLKFVLCYLVFLQLGSLFLWRCVFPIELFYLTWGITTAYHSCVLAAVGFSNVAFGVLKCYGNKWHVILKGLICYSYLDVLPKMSSIHSPEKSLAFVIPTGCIKPFVVHCAWSSILWVL